ncbi:putative short-chain acyl-CoA dehydrogenase [Streptomyces sp. NBRC 110611]|nr:putative short-chain acyl-CoA dehydrogenase [Streptomyces sp. NBRC 110611]
MLGALLGEVRQPLDGDDLAALDLSGGDETRTHGHAVEPDGARPALALLAGVLRARQAEPLAQHVQQGLALPDVVGFLRPSVDREIHAHYATPSVRAAVPRYDSQAQVSVRRAMTPTAWRR